VRVITCMYSPWNSVPEICSKYYFKREARPKVRPHPRFNFPFPSLIVNGAGSKNVFPKAAELKKTFQWSSRRSLGATILPFGLLECKRETNETTPSTQVQE
jgi:hypothetical protein